MQSLRAALNGTNNSFGFIRLVLALLVIVDHAFILGGFGFNPIHGLVRGQASLGSLAVAGFFAISGYLIAKSGGSGDVLQFVWRRVLRIFPAFWVVLVLTAFVAAPVVWVSGGRSLGDFFSLSDGPLHYLASNWTLSIGSHGFDDLLLDTPYGQSSGMSEFNGSLWTLALEWICYLAVAVLVASGVLRHAKPVVPAVAGLLLLVQTGAIDGSQLPLLSNMAFTPLALAFFTGATLAVYSGRVPFSDGLGILSGVVMLATLRFGGFASVGIVAGACFVLYLGARLPAGLRRIGRKNDYSYGIYIYGFLAQQLGANWGAHELGYVPYVLIAVVVASALAWLSWHGVEKHAMKLKDRGPGRGLRYWYSKLRRVSP